METNVVSETQVDRAIRELREEVLSLRQENKSLRGDMDLLRSGRLGTLGFKTAALAGSGSLFTRMYRDGSVTDDKIESLAVEKLLAGEIQVELDIVAGGKITWSDGSGQLDQSGVQIEAETKRAYVTFVDALRDPDDIDAGTVYPRSDLYGQIQSGLHAIGLRAFSDENDYTDMIVYADGSSSYWNLDALQGGSVLASLTVEAQNSGNGYIDCRIGRLRLYDVTSDPTTLSDGSLWYRTDTDEFMGRRNGSSLAFLMEGDAGGGMKTASGGYFQLPAAPSGGTAVTGSGSTNTWSGWTEVSASAPANLYIVGAMVRQSTSVLCTYIALDIGTGAAAAETSIGDWVFPGSDPGTDEGLRGLPVTFPYAIPVASGTRIAVQVASNAASVNANVHLICINQADVVSL